MKEDLLTSYDESIKQLVQHIASCCDNFLKASTPGTISQSRANLLGSLEVFKNFMDLRDKIEKGITDETAK
jgi:hypothetical protein